MEDLVKQISKDLCIHRYEMETKLDFNQRLIFSVLAAWMRMQIFSDPDNLNDEKKVDFDSVDVNQFISSIRKIAKYLLELFPVNLDWLTGENEQESLTNILNCIYQEMIYCGDIIRVKSRRITLLEDDFVDFGIARKLYGNPDKIYKNMNAIGGSRWEYNPMGEFKFPNNIFNGDIKDYYLELLNNTKWKEGEIFSECEMFSVGTQGRYSTAWKPYSKEKLKTGLYLFRTALIKKQFFLIKICDEKVYRKNLDEWYYDSNERYRIMYALNYNNQSPAVFKYKNKDFYELICTTKLPDYERNILLSISWPYRDCGDLYQRIIPKQLWPIAVAVCKRLGIHLEEIEIKRS